jgi:hypothetical protein
LPIEIDNYLQPGQKVSLGDPNYGTYGSSYSLSPGNTRVGDSVMGSAPASKLNQPWHATSGNINKQNLVNPGNFLDFICFFKYQMRQLPLNLLYFHQFPTQQASTLEMFIRVTQQFYIHQWEAIYVNLVI